MRTKKTRLMQRAERQLEGPLEERLAPFINRRGLSDAAGDLGVSISTLSYWLVKLGFRMERVCLAPTETLEIKRTVSRE